MPDPTKQTPGAEDQNYLVSDTPSWTIEFRLDGITHFITDETPERTLDRMKAVQASVDSNRLEIIGSYATQRHPITSYIHWEKTHPPPKRLGYYHTLIRETDVGKTVVVMKETDCGPVSIFCEVDDNLKALVVRAALAIVEDQDLLIY